MPWVFLSTFILVGGFLFYCAYRSSKECAEWAHAKGGTPRYITYTGCVAVMPDGTVRMPSR